MTILNGYNEIIAKLCNSYKIGLQAWRSLELWFVIKEIKKIELSIGKKFWIASR